MKFLIAFVILLTACALAQTVRIATTPGVRVIVEQQPEPPPMPSVAKSPYTLETSVSTNRTSDAAPPRFRCVSVQIKLLRTQVGDGRGLPTDQWQTERRYVATLEPVLIGGTNRVWGRYREKTVDLVTTEESIFHDGGLYDLVPVQ